MSLKRGGFGEDFKQRACDLRGMWLWTGFLSPQRPLLVPGASHAARSGGREREDPGAGVELALEHRTVDRHPQPGICFIRNVARTCYQHPIKLPMEHSD